MKLLRTIRLDPSDTFIFETWATPGEWAVAGTFAFWDQDIMSGSAKMRAAFRSGFLGVDSMGWSTLAVVTAIDEDERILVMERLASHIMSRFAAPDLDTARKVATEELAHSESLCTPSEGTLVAVHRTLVENDIREQYRILQFFDRKTEHQFRAFDFVETDDIEEPTTDDTFALVNISHNVTP